MDYAYSENIALLIVDVQRGFINEETKHIPNLVEKLQSQYRFVFATQFFNSPNSNYRRLIQWAQCDPSSVDIELAFKPELHTTIIQKPIYSCVNAGFVHILLTNRIDTIHVCGIDTDICVTKCAVDLFELGFTPFVLKDYSASHAGLAVHDAAIATLARFLGKGQII